MALAGSGKPPTRERGGCHEEDSGSSRRRIGWLVARTGDRCGFGLTLCLGYPGNCCPWVPLASAPSAAARYGRLHHRMKSHGKIGKINRKAIRGADRCLCLDVGGVHGNPRPEITAALNTRSA